jgi:hypothetical protein
MAILLAVLLFDILLTVFLGATAIPVNIIMGTLLTILFTLSLAGSVCEMERMANEEYREFQSIWKSIQFNHINSTEHITNLCINKAVKHMSN